MFVVSLKGDMIQIFEGTSHTFMAFVFTQLTLEREREVSNAMLTLFKLCFIGTRTS